MRGRKWLAGAAAVVAVIAGSAAPAGADGTETLGEPSIEVASGTGITVAGVGLFEQPSDLTVTVPEDATVNQVIMYWESGHRHDDDDEPGPSTIQINGVEVDAEHISESVLFYEDVFTLTHRADITGLGFVGPGSSTLSFSGLPEGDVNDGAGVFVIYSEPGEPESEVQLVDGNDIAFFGFEEPRKTTIPQTLSFEPAEEDRTATLSMMVSSIHDPHPGCSCRPNFLEYTIGDATTRLADPFEDTEGREFDTKDFEILIPAGADSITVEMISEPQEGGSETDLPASLVWLMAALAVPPAQPPPTTTTAPPTTTTAPPTTTTTPPTTAAAAVAAQQAQLPTTGTRSSTVPVALFGVSAAALGALLVVLTRRRLARQQA